MMENKLVVQKFGGSSVANVDRLEVVARRIIDYAKKGCRLAVVVSAMGDTTDELVSLAKRINPHPSAREMDMVISTGEQISCALLAMALHKKGWEAISFTGHQVGIITDTSHTRAKILRVRAHRILQELSQKKIVIIAGFQGVSTDSEITTLGRGGSDLSAVALAVGLGADMCEIYTDVDGIYTTDPRIVSGARKINVITFDEMLELAYSGAIVMQTRAVEVAKKFNIPLHVRSSFTKKEGTIIMERNGLIEEPVVRGVALMEGESKITICNVPDSPGIAASVFEKIAKKGINVDIIVQNVSHRDVTDISFTVNENDGKRAFDIVEKNFKKLGATTVLFDNNIAKISIVGIGMRSHSGVASKMFKALALEKINIEMISTSEINISCIVRRKDGKRAVKFLHQAFGLNKPDRKAKKRRN